MDILITGDPDYTNWEAIVDRLQVLALGTVTYNNIIVIEDGNPSRYASEQAPGLYLGIIKIPKDPRFDTTDSAWINSVLEISKPGEVWIFTKDATQSEYCKRVAFHSHRRKILTQIIH